MDLKQKIETALSNIIDSGTSLDIMKMQVVKNLSINEYGDVSLSFSPSSSVCPLAFQLAINIQDAIKQIEGVAEITIKIENYNRADELEKVLTENK